jgi:glycosyltransferase involved in cell wall biosynthesis
MRVGWLADEPDVPGGAELTQAEFRAAATEGVEIVDCPPGGVVPGLDRYVIHNCVQYTLDDLRKLGGAVAIKYHHDVGPWLQADVRDWLGTRARHVCCSPIQADHMGLDDVAHIPPPVDLDRFAKAAESVNGNRAGSVCVGSWRNYGKAPHKAAEWGARNGGIDFYGGGPLAPRDCVEVDYEQMPALLARYERFVFLPTVLEPFGRVVAEAWAAGCAIVTNELVGAGYWIQEDPDAIESAGADFWAVVLA